MYANALSSRFLWYAIPGLAIIGACVLALYAAQWVGGAWVFYGGAAASTRTAFLPLHARCGRLLVTGALLS